MRTCNCISGPPPGGVCSACGAPGVGYAPRPTRPLSERVRRVVCPHCDGDGYIERWVEDSQGRDYPVAIPCDRCDGIAAGVV